MDDYPLIVVGCGKIECKNGVIIDVHHVSSLSANLFSETQLTQIGKRVEF